VNGRLHADFDPDAFDHVPRWDAAGECVDIRLRARSPQVVSIADLDLTVDFAAGEELHTEISAKFRRDRVSAELAEAGLEVRRWWTDPSEGFGVALARRL
jgi:L-histidine N-alpha-methyltransferase